jgi:hypothetical protein
MKKIVSGKREGGRGKVELRRRKWSGGTSTVNGKRNKKKKKKKKMRKWGGEKGRRSGRG